MQGAADLAAREISRTPLPAETTLETVLADGSLNAIFSEDNLVFDLDTLGPGQSFFQDVVGGWPVLNQQLATTMIVDRPDLNGDRTPDRNFIRYPGALLVDATKPTGYTVGEEQPGTQANSSVARWKGKSATQVSNHRNRRHQEKRRNGRRKASKVQNNARNR